MYIVFEHILLDAYYATAVILYATENIYREMYTWTSALHEMSNCNKKNS
jgi:hypothetical protein